MGLKKLLSGIAIGGLALEPQAARAAEEKPLPAVIQPAVAQDEAKLNFYNKLPSGNETMDSMNRWFYQVPEKGGYCRTPIEKIDMSVLQGDNLDNISNGWGQTLMTSAVLNGRADLVDLLLKNGAKADAPNFSSANREDGQKPLELAKDRARFATDESAGQIVTLLEKSLADKAQNQPFWSSLTQSVR